jgi:alpha-amylase/alpha-mannosidase (GH57 family)
MPDCYLCIHGHFYQPPRVDPFTGYIPREPDAAPYANWNERINAECYTPNAEAGHFGMLSFNIGGTLARWLSQYASVTYERIIADERAYLARHGVGNGLAQPVHHTILPLARHRDKVCQVRWGIASFKHRFGHEPVGMWLPEMAVDYETLEVMAAEGIRFTILSDEQVRGDLQLGAGPYRVRLSGSREIAVFVRDRHLSNALSFGMPDPAHVDEWLREQLTWRCHEGRLVLIATDGETFGHHHRQGVEVLRRILSAGGKCGYQLTTLGVYLRDHPPRAELEVLENTAWSCSHRLDRWSLGCGCTPGDSRWKGALRRAMDNLACDLDLALRCFTEKRDIDPWPLRDRYIAVVTGQMEGPDFLKAQGLGHMPRIDQERLLWLLEAQYYRQRMYASCAFFFDDLDRLEPRYAIANGIRALALTLYATGEDLSRSFRRDLSLAVSGKTGRTGADIFDIMVATATVRS